MKLKVNSDWQPQSQSENSNGNLSRFIPQEDAIYDYERVPPAWSGFDEQADAYAHSDQCSAHDEHTELGKRAS